MLDRGVSMNMVILTRKEPNAFDRNRFPDNFWLANLFGRATHNLVLSEELREAYELVDRELRVVADIQRALLPKQMPQIESLELAAYYRTISVTDGIYRAGRSAALSHPSQFMMNQVQARKRQKRGRAARRNVFSPRLRANGSEPVPVFEPCQKTGWVGC